MLEELSPYLFWTSLVVLTIAVLVLMCLIHSEWMENYVRQDDEDECRMSSPGESEHRQLAEAIAKARKEGRL